jgi:hypothetical protein
MPEDGQDDEPVAELQRRMAQAVEEEDFETAARLRDALAARGIDGPGGFRRQTPGRMGLGSDQGVYQPPQGWTPPPRPDPMTAGRKRPRGRRR